MAVQPPGLGAGQSVAAVCDPEGDVAALQAELEEEEAEEAPKTFRELWHAVGQNPAAMAAVEKAGGRVVRATRAVPVGAEATKKRVGGVLGSMVSTGQASIASLTTQQRITLSSRIAVHLGLAPDAVAADACEATRRTALKHIVGCYETYYVETTDRTFTLQGLLPTKEYASLSMKHLKDLSCDYTSVRARACHCVW